MSDYKINGKRSVAKSLICRHFAEIKAVTNPKLGRKSHITSGRRRAFGVFTACRNQLGGGCITKRSKGSERTRLNDDSGGIGQKYRERKSRADDFDEILDEKQNCAAPATYRKVSRTYAVLRL
ncbi:MAG: hypothetical protein IPH54_20685 [Rhodoferax sp.]|nr:hypothetical protein [Rhodoferax sp.]